MQFSFIARFQGQVYGEKILRKKLLILSHDLGVKNYGIAVVTASLGQGKRLNLSIQMNGMLKHTISQLKRGKLHHEQMHEYLKENKEIFQEYNPEFFVAERFQARGRSGTTIESINQMMGSIVSRIGIPYAQITAGTWKNEIKRWDMDLEKIYKMARVTPHQVDAVMMAAYIGYLKLGAKRTKLNAKVLVAAIEAASKEPLKEKKKKKGKKK